MFAQRSYTNFIYECVYVCVREAKSLRDEYKFAGGPLLRRHVEYLFGFRDVLQPPSSSPKIRLGYGLEEMTRLVAKIGLDTEKSDSISFYHWL